jgi:hypothetical protein
MHLPPATRPPPPPNDHPRRWVRQLRRWRWRDAALGGGVMARLRRTRRAYTDRRRRARVSPILGWRMSGAMSGGAGTQATPSKLPSGVRHSIRRGPKLMPATEIRRHSAHRINAAVAATPGTRARSVPTTSISPWPPEHPQGQTFRPFAIRRLSHVTVSIARGVGRAGRRPTNGTIIAGLCWKLRRRTPQGRNHTLHHRVNGL